MWNSSVTTAQNLLPPCLLAACRWECVFAKYTWHPHSCHCGCYGWVKRYRRDQMKAHIWRKRAYLNPGHLVHGGPALSRGCWTRWLPEVLSSLSHSEKLEIPMLWKLLFCKFSSRLSWEDPHAVHLKWRSFSVSYSKLGITSVWSCQAIIRHIWEVMTPLHWGMCLLETTVA